MALDMASSRRSISPASSGRSSPVPRASRRAVEDGLYKGDKSLRRYAALIERALNSWETAPQEWADYIAFLGRLLKAVQSLPKDAPLLPHTAVVASRLAQCLNPALPSGVHQKALEVYSFIFTTFGSEYLATHLHDYLPGLSPVLSFASLSVRPAVYELFEGYVTKLPLSTLRPVLRSLVLSLLPAIEDETSEDFDRAFNILQQLQSRFDPDGSNGYFWQCLFLCVITSPSRRQGALNYITRKLPVLAPTTKDVTAGVLSPATDDDHAQLSSEAEAALSPEPGLLVRCFIAGLADQQALVQRGFLDVLVTHLPLHSNALQHTAEQSDLEKLITAALQILLRRDMSLNRRVWSWFLGPTASEHIAENGPASPTSERAPTAAGTDSTPQLLYFDKFAKAPLKRCILAMLSRTPASAAELARPFRICLSLMDRWEIGGTLIPEVFLLSLQRIHAYSKSASPDETAEVMRSASLFFDGVEATLIWSSLIGVLRDALDADEPQPDSLGFVEWTLSRFNLRDEEMSTVHVPLALLSMTGILNSRAFHPHNSWLSSALNVLARLVELVSPSVFKTVSGSDSESAAIRGHRSQLSNTELESAVGEFYGEARKLPTNQAPLLFGGRPVGELVMQQTCELILRLVRLDSGMPFRRATDILLGTQKKSPQLIAHIASDLLAAIGRALIPRADGEGGAMTLPSLGAAVTVLAVLQTNAETTRHARQLVTPIGEHVWPYLSPSQPKYHVEAVRMLWQLNDMSAVDAPLKACLLDFAQQETDDEGKEAIGRFTILWEYSVAPPQQSSVTGTGRRGSALPMVSDAAQAARRLEVLSEPLLRILDHLHEPRSATAALASRWLKDLPTLSAVFSVLFERLVGLLEPLPSKNSDGKENERDFRARLRSLAYMLTLFTDLLHQGSDWTWRCLDSTTTETTTGTEAGQEDGLAALARVCVSLLVSPETSDKVLDQVVLELLETLLAAPTAAKLRHLDLDVALLDRLTSSLYRGEMGLQGLMLRLTTAAINLRARDASADVVAKDTRRESVSAARYPIAMSRPNGMLEMTAPPAQLLPCLRLAFATKAARTEIHLWIRFLSDVLPIFGTAIFASLIPLVETLCAEINSVFTDLVSLTRTLSNTHSWPSAALDAGLLGLLEALEITLARSHACLVHDSDVEEAAIKASSQPNTFLGGVASGVFKIEGPPSKTSPSNRRLTVILAFHDAIRVCVKIWKWSNHFADVDDYDKTSAATTSHCAVRMRNKTRYLLEQMFAVEFLESLEVLVLEWTTTRVEAHAEATISLLHVMQGSRPKHVLPAILDALCTRANPSALPSARVSSQTVDVNAPEIALYLLDYLHSVEDDAMDEIWPDCVTFLRDVLANPLPWRQVMPALLSLMLVLARKVGNTNFGEQKRMRRELADIFQRALAAAFSTLPSSFVAEPPPASPSLREHKGLAVLARQRSLTLSAVLVEIVEELDIILDTPERVNASVNSISASMLSPILHAKAFPSNVGPEQLRLLLATAKKAPASKSWKRDIADVFNDPRFFLSTPLVMRDYWFPVLYQWTLRDKDRMHELLSRLSAPTSAGIMFGVGANAARLEADRKTQLNIRRICLLLLASPSDSWSAHLADFDEKLNELFGATHSSSPSSTIKPELFMLCRTLILCLSQSNLSPLWPIINDNLQLSLASLASRGHQGPPAYTNLGLLQACRLLDQLIALSPDEFQLHEWLYIADTVDAVYQPTGWTPVGLADQVAEALGHAEVDESMTLPTPVDVTQQGSPRARRLLLDSRNSDSEDIKAMSRDDFALAVVRPFLTQLSIHAYEGMYSMEPSSLEACRQCLLEDLLDIRTVVE